jgi:hypothetical protein
VGLKNNKGAISFWVSGPHPDWATNALRYQFPTSPTSQDGVFIESTKHPDKTIVVTVKDGDGDSVTFRNPVPTPVSTVTPNGVHIVVNWKNGKVDLYLNAQPAGSVVLP